MKLPRLIEYYFRKQRADVLTAAIIKTINPILAEHEARGYEGGVRRDLAHAIRALFYESGAEVISDADREAAGLAPRDEQGLTADELRVLEARRLELMLRPLSMTFPANAPEVARVKEVATR